MPTLAALACAAALAPAASAHEGDPNYLSQIKSVTPNDPGVKLTVLNRDDRLELLNTSGKTILIRGYQDEPYARIGADGTVEVNTDSEAYYLNRDRKGEETAPAGVDSKGPPQWKRISRTGRFEWHDHRFHWMGEGTPKQVKDESVRTKVFDWSIPIEVGGQPGRIAGTLFWTPQPGGGPPLAAVIAFAGIAIALSIAVFVVRRRRATDAGDPEEAEPQREAVEAW